MQRPLNPLAIAGILAAVLVGGAWGWSVYEDHQREARREALEPLEAEWARLRERAVSSLVKIEAVLIDASEAGEETCPGLEAEVDVIHRPILQALAAGERFPRADAPWWLSSDPYAYLAGALTPSMNVDAYQKRNDILEQALQRSCVAVLDTAVAEPTRVQEQRFEGGTVLGVLRVVCPRQDKVLCRIPLVSQPSFAIVAEQRDASAQDRANAMAVNDAARREYRETARQALRDARR